MEYLVLTRGVFCACTRADEQRAGCEGGLDGKVADAVCDEPDVARPRHPSGGGRKIVDEMRDASELGANGRAHDKLVKDIFIVQLRWRLL